MSHPVFANSYHPVTQSPGFPHLAVQLFKQQKAYSCGPAALLIAMSHYGRLPEGLDEGILRKFCWTSKTGTAEFRLVAAAKKWGFEVQQGTRGTRELMEGFLAKGYPLLVSYKDSPTSYHYAVAVASPPWGNDITLADPWFKAFVTWSWPEFQASWDNPKEELEGWWMAIKPKDLSAKQLPKYQ